MFKEGIYSPDYLASIDTEIIGGVRTGDKGAQLIEKTPLLRRLGCSTPPVTVLSEEFFDDFFYRNGLGKTLQEVDKDPSVMNVIKSGSFSEIHFRIIERFAQKCCGPVAVRSSASGDSRGTGIYHSEFVSNKPGEIRKAIQRVLSSYFSESAIQFRKDAQTGEGFAILLEPVVGSEHQTGGFAPVLSGFGYTSTVSGGGYLTVVPGLGGGVDTKLGERVTEENLQEHQGILYEYVREERFKDVTLKQPRKISSLRQNGFGRSRFENYFTADFITESKNSGKCNVISGGFAFSDDEYDLYQTLDFRPFFLILKQLEEILGVPQYIEWALTLEERKPKIWITQIADVVPQLDIVDFKNHGTELFGGVSVVGTGQFNSNTIVICKTVADIGRLHQFNKTHTGYILVFSSDLTSSTTSKYASTSLTYAHISNASVLIELTHQSHVNHPLAHFSGQLNMTGKLFAIGESFNLSSMMLDQQETDDETGLPVVHGNFTTVGSEKYNKLTIFQK